MASVENLSSSELRRKLAEYGYAAGPITETSRKVLLKKLKLLMVQAGRSSDVTTTGKWRRSSSRFSSGEEDNENDDLKMRLNSSMPPQSSNFRTPVRNLSVESLSDSELRCKLEEYGFPAGPVTETSRNVLKKKLKLLMAQSGGSSDVTVASKWRRSSSRFSSGDEDSENDDLKMRLNSSMPPPSSNFRTPRRKSTGRLSEYSVTPGRLGIRKEMNSRNDVFSVPKTLIPESDPSKKRHSHLSSPGLNPGSLSNSSVRRLSSRPTVSSVVNDGFETGSDSDIDSKTLESNASLVLPTSSSSASAPCSSFLSRLSSVRPKHKSDYSGGDSSSANTLLRFRKSFQSAGSTTNIADSLTANRSAHSPFQSNFVKRLSGTFGTRGSTPSSIFDVKENDDVSNSPDGLFNPSRRLGFSPQSDLAQEFKTTDDEVKFGCNSQFVSMILLAVAALFFTVLAIMYVSMRSRDALNFGLEDKANTFPICPQEVAGAKSVTSEELCVDHQELMPAVKMAKLLHPVLNQRAISQQCYGGHAAMMTHSDVIKWLMKKDTTSGGLLEHHLRSLKILLISNPHWGIQVVESPMADTTGSTSSHYIVDTGGLIVTDPDLPVLCYLKTKVQGILITFMYSILGICVLYGIKLATQWYMRRRKQDKLEVYKMVERIIELLVNHQRNASPGKQPFLAVNHVRDQLIPPPDRSRLAKVWNQAVQWIKNSESRVRCEMQSIAGEEFPVWRWLPHASTSYISSAISSEQSTPRRNNKVWQGQAFDTMSGSPNSPPCSPTPCLKIRHMFDPDMEFGDEWPVRVQDAILEKCAEEGVVALHISVDSASREGCVYLKCASQEDAGHAYRALHGWWFDSNLVTVKYLRLERYHERFPEAEGAVVPIHPSNNQKLSLQWQNPLESN
ncbi:hypothetical protein B7P43_G15419 [Cryptotermes secundus]|uniref:LEM domain-containing protein n=1 Tax=Cryptotermes secundus TaxID=105785 RepID=A0A2J7Q1J3_9NEOP|nr:uncharacterized protein LOC111870442 isoform X2 [Cryptotermes secundus]PNF22452.1 hypothetical protein B7P43_G15419 [Cryptotermes secundus]PNF22454.1 hypothetical protein B7P43_G15419 [Cryptotermes secundus]